MAGSNRRVITFGKDWVPLVGVCDDDSGNCLRCSGELVEILPKYIAATIRTLVKALRHLEASAEAITEAWNQAELPPPEHLGELVDELEKNIRELFSAADAILPFRVWNDSPEQRANAAPPPALDDLLAVEDFAFWVYHRLLAGGDAECLGESWRSSPFIASECKSLVEPLAKHLASNPELMAAVAAMASNKLQLPLNNLDGVDYSRFCCQECFDTFVDLFGLEVVKNLTTRKYHKIDDATWEKIGEYYDSIDEEQVADESCTESEKLKLLSRLKKCIRLAYLAAAVAEKQNGRELTDVETWKWLRENMGDSELAGYRLPPKQESFARFLTKARAAVGESRKLTRRGRTSRSIVKQSES